MKASFREQGIAKLDRLTQDEVQQACSGEKPPSEDVAKRLEAAQLATVKWPADGVYLGDWREGEKLAQNGRGMTWTDPAGVPSGGNCYNCHQITKAEISFGTIGPSLYQYGKLRGVTDPAAPASSEMLKYTWAKLWNAKASNACSNMPRFGHAGRADAGADPRPDGAAARPEVAGQRAVATGATRRRHRVVPGLARGAPNALPCHAPPRGQVARAVHGPLPCLLQQQTPSPTLPSRCSASTTGRPRSRTA